MARIHCKYTLLIISYFIAFSAWGSNIDSLVNLLQSAKEDTTQIRLLNEISWAYNRTDLKLTEEYANKALKISKNIGHKKGHARALNLLGIVESGNGNLERSIRYNLEGLKLAEAIANDYLISVTTNDLGNSFSAKGKLKEALKYYQRSLKLAKKGNDILGIAFTTNNIGVLHQRMGNSEKALDYFEVAVEVGKTSTDPMVLAGAYSSLSGLYYEKKDFDQSLEYEKKALKIALKAQDRFSACYSYLYIGELQQKKGFSEMAQKNYDAALNQAEQLGDNSLITNCYLSFASFSNKKKDFEKAIIHGEKVIEMSKIHEFEDLANAAHYQLAKSYAGKGNFEKAYEYSQAYNDLADSIYTKDNQRIIAELETLYETKEAQKENKTLRTKNMKNERIIKQRTTIMFISIVCFLLLIGLGIAIYNGYRIRKASLMALEEKVKERTKELEDSYRSLQQTNAALERFNYIASHDLKEPLRNISSFSDLLLRKANKTGDKNTLEYLGFIKRGSTRMFELVEAMRKVSNIRKRNILFEAIDINEVIKGVGEDLSQIIQERNAVISYQQLPIVRGDVALLNILFQNLIKNGIKFNQNQQPNIEIYATETLENHVFNIKDNGIGIDEQYYKKVFEAFKRLHHYEQYSGTGIGLFISKDIVEMHKGRIWIEANEPEGTIFKFTIPKNTTPDL